MEGAPTSATLDEGREPACHERAAGAPPPPRPAPPAFLLVPSGG